MNFRRYLEIIARAPEDGSGGGAGGAGASGGGAEAGSGGGAAAGAGAGGAGAGAGAGGAGAGDGSGAGGSWYAPLNLDADTVSWIEERKFGDLASTLKAGREGSKFASARNVIEKPDPAKPQDWKGYTEIGWVEDATKYGVKPPKPDAAKGEHLDEQMHRDFVASAHKAKVAPWQAEAIFNDMFAVMNKRVADMEAAGARTTQELQTALRNEWGTEFDAKQQLGQRAFNALGLKPADGKKLEDFLGSSPAMAKAFAAIGEMMGEDKLRLGNAPVGGQKSESALRTELNALTADATFKAAFHNPQHPQHADMKAKRQALIDQLAKAEIARTQSGNRAA